MVALGEPVMLNLAPCHRKISSEFFFHILQRAKDCRFCEIWRYVIAYLKRTRRLYLPNKTTDIHAINVIHLCCLRGSSYVNS